MLALKEPFMKKMKPFYDQMFNLLKNFEVIKNHIQSFRFFSMKEDRMRLAIKYVAQFKLDPNVLLVTQFSEPVYLLFLWICYTVDMSQFYLTKEKRKLETTRLESQQKKVKKEILESEEFLTVLDETIRNQPKEISDFKSTIREIQGQLDLKLRLK